MHEYEYERSEPLVVDVGSEDEMEEEVGGEEAALAIVMEQQEEEQVAVPFDSDDLYS